MINHCNDLWYECLFALFIRVYRGDCLQGFLKQWLYSSSRTWWQEFLVLPNDLSDRWRVQHALYINMYWFFPAVKGSWLQFWVPHWCLKNCWDQLWIKILCNLSEWFCQILGFFECKFSRPNSCYNYWNGKTWLYCLMCQWHNCSSPLVAIVTMLVSCLSYCS